MASGGDVISGVFAGGEISQLSSCNIEGQERNAKMNGIFFGLLQNLLSNFSYYSLSESLPALVCQSLHSLPQLDSLPVAAAPDKMAAAEPWAWRRSGGEARRPAAAHADPLATGRQPRRAIKIKARHAEYIFISPALRRASSPRRCPPRLLARTSSSAPSSSS